MKNVLYTLAILIGTMGYAQNDQNPVDHMQTTKVKTETVVKDGKAIQNKIKVVTTKEQEVKTDPRQAGMRDADQIIAPTKVKKTISIDNDGDSAYDTQSTVTYYVYNDVKYAFKTNSNGFVVTSRNGDNEIQLGNARKSSRSDLYIFNTATYSGVGYFDNNHFVVEYYNKDSDVLITERFEQNEF